MISTCPLISKPSSPCINPLVIVPSALIIIGITVTFMFFFGGGHFSGKVLVLICITVTFIGFFFQFSGKILVLIYITVTFIVFLYFVSIFRQDLGTNLFFRFPSVLPTDQPEQRNYIITCVKRKLNLALNIHTNAKKLTNIPANSVSVYQNFIWRRKNKE